MLIAVSLLACDDMSLMRPCIESLIASDISLYDFKIFCIDNNSSDGVGEFLESLKVPLWIKRNPKNEGIVIPRIEIMEQIQAEGFDYTVELHADMLFPAKWIAPLIAAMDDTTAITMPFILNNPRKMLTVPQVEALVERFTDHGIIENVRQVHPWLLNNSIVRKIGYYDAVFSPNNCEDDDFMWCVKKAGYKTKAIKESIVVHYGEKTRRLLPNPYGTLAAHFEKFRVKHGITIGEMVAGFTMHPIISNY